MSSNIEKSHPLDNPCWEALSGRQAEFAIKGDNVLRYRPDVFMMAGIPDDTEVSIKNLSRLVPTDHVIAIIGLKIDPDNPDWQELGGFNVLQMITYEVPEYPKAEYEELSDDDVPEMMKLVELTKPGPFAPRTIELGKYIGIKQNNKLIAMAGERIKIDGYTEVSAICTHPNHRGNGYAKALTGLLTEEIMGRGEKVFLHVMSHNVPALKLYERLGFATRKEMPITAYKRR